jgi:5-methyltetrahydrofolate--homocysteine methyltransferase
MERKKLNIPVLIGGATTSRIHTAVKLDPNYSGSVIHVLDASKSVPVASNLISQDKEQVAGFKQKMKDEYEKLRTDHLQKRGAKLYLTLKEARVKKFKSEWDQKNIKLPTFFGYKVLDDISLGDLLPYIDWSPFFSSWELKGKYPAILKDPVVGQEAKKLFNDALELLNNIVTNKYLQAKAVFGFFPANSVGDDVELYESCTSEQKEEKIPGHNENRESILTHIHFLRQQNKKAPNLPNLSLSDFIAPKESGVNDYIGAFVVSTGFGADELSKKFEKELDDYNSIMVKALADRLAEALAEFLHEKVRKEYWGYAAEEHLNHDDIIREKYKGIRPAPGYPACPDHLEKRVLFNLLNAEENIGVTLTENFAMFPAASVSGWYIAHPEAKYFGVGKIEKDQVDDYAKRKNMSRKEIEKWLSPNLSYDI